MKLIKKINGNTALNEDAAGGSVGAGAIGMCAMPLFATLVKRSAPKVKTIKWHTVKKTKKKPSIGLKEAFDRLYEFDMGSGAMNTSMDGKPTGNSSSNAFDPTSVIAKLKGLENKEKKDHRNTVSFGLEDDNGGIVRVTVSSEQAEDFEKSLQAFMANAEEEDGVVPEIAEVLFKLKDRFDIIDVQWPEVHEDEEEDMSLAGGEGDGQPGGDASDMDLGDAPPEDPAGAPPVSGGDDGQVKDLLVQVIDMMKADAEARKAEARAREAEAKTKEADTIVKQITSKVKQEEQFLDMETYNKAKKDEEREAKRLAALAKWKHDMSKDEGITDDDDFGSDAEQSLSAPAPNSPPADPGVKQGGREEEEHVMRRPTPIKAQPVQTPKAVIRGRVHPHDIASFILSRVK